VTETNPPLRTIKEFIDDHERILAVIGVLTGIAVLWQQLPTANSISPAVPLWCILATLPLYFEIWRRFDGSKSTWSLIVFLNLFTPIIVGTARYVFVAFRPQWEEAMPQIIGGVLLIAAYFVYPLVKIPKLAEKWERRRRERSFRKHNFNEDERIHYEEQYPVEKDAKDFAILFTGLYICVVLGISSLLSGVIAKPINAFLTSQFEGYSKPALTTPDASPQP
jgi:hypothetical protein